jgi:hypothetical protein
MDRFEDARRQERRGHLKLFLYSSILLAAFVAAWVTMNQEEIEIFDLLFYGATKSIVWIVVLVVGGVSACFYVLSVSSVVLILRLARLYKRRNARWKLIAMPLFFGLAGWMISNFLLEALEFLAVMQDAINSWFSFIEIEHPFWFFFAAAIWLIFSISLLVCIGAILLLIISLSLDVNKFVFEEHAGSPP